MDHKITASLLPMAVPIDSVRPDKKNARKRTDRNLETLKRSLQTFGQQKPIVVDGDGVIRAGNGTWLAAQQLGWKQIAVVPSDLGPDELAAYAVADNRTGELAEWDNGQLAAVLSEIQASGDMDVEAMGFNQDEVDAIVDDVMGEDRITQHDVRPPPKMAWVLVGIPTVRFGEIADQVEAIGRVDGVICKSVVSDKGAERGDVDQDG